MPPGYRHGSVHVCVGERDRLREREKESHDSNFKSSITIGITETAITKPKIWIWIWTIGLIRGHYMEQCDCGPPLGATGQSGGVSWIETSVSGTQTPHQLSNQTWNHFEYVFKTSCDNFHVILGPMLQQDSQAAKPLPAGYELLHPHPLLKKIYKPFWDQETPGDRLVTLGQ